MDTGETLRQLGGNKFIVMTGAKNLVAGGDSLSFRVGRNCKGISGILIKLNVLDLYDITAYQIRKGKVKEVAGEENIYAEDLQPAFTRLTGMDAHL